MNSPTVQTPYVYPQYAYCCRRPSMALINTFNWTQCKSFTRYVRNACTRQQIVMVIRGSLHLAYQQVKPHWFIYLVCDHTVLVLACTERAYRCTSMACEVLQYPVHCYAYKNREYLRTLRIFSVTTEILAVFAGLREAKHTCFTVHACLCMTAKASIFCRLEARKQTLHTTRTI